MSNKTKEYGWISAKKLDDHDYTIPAIIDLLPTGTLSILDAGCGNGYIANKLHALGHTVTGIDQSKDGIKIAKQSYPDVEWYNYSVYDDLTSISGDGFDVIVSSEVIEHLYNPKEFLLNMRKYLNDDGVIILTTPYHGYIKNLALSVFNAWDKHHTVDWVGGSY